MYEEYSMDETDELTSERNYT